MTEINLDFMLEFQGNLHTFTSALQQANENCADLITKRPGFSSEEFTAKLMEMKNKLNSLTEKWQEISQNAENHIGQTVGEIKARKDAIERTL